jgi:hypothetical protein
MQVSPFELEQRLAWRRAAPDKGKVEGLVLVGFGRSAREAAGYPPRSTPAVSPTPPSAPTPTLTVIGRALNGQPRTYRLARPSRGRSVAAVGRRLACVLFGDWMADPKTLHMESPAHDADRQAEPTGFRSAGNYNQQAA